MMTDQSPEIVFVLGTRPEIIKLAPVIRACDRYHVPFSLLHTGQHYSEELNGTFFEQLELPSPDYKLEVGSGLHGEQTGEMIAEIESIVLEECPDIVLVQGDTNSVLAGAIATSKLDIEIGHVEAGLRSFDRDMPEETNRVLADHVADYLFAPTEEAARLLREEGITENVFITGNTIVDAVQKHYELASEQSNVLSRLGIVDSTFGLLTAHRAENVDDEATFTSLLEGIHKVALDLDTKIIYPIHPRAADNVKEYGINIPTSVRCIEPQDYLDFLVLENNADFVLTDSGGVQEEACILQTPCVTLRENTERPETIDVGANVLAGTTPEQIRRCVGKMVTISSGWENPFGDGSSAERIVQILHDGSRAGFTEMNEDHKHDKHASYELP